MAQIIEHTLASGYAGAQRLKIRKALDAISNDIGMAMRDAGLGNIPVYLTIVNSGDAIATLATPLDPSDDDWSRVLEIACSAIQREIGSGKLRSREMAYAAINTAITPAGVTAS